MYVDVSVMYEVVVVCWQKVVFKNILSRKKNCFHIIVRFDYIDVILTGRSVVPPPAAWYYSTGILSWTWSDKKNKSELDLNPSMWSTQSNPAWYGFWLFWCLYYETLTLLHPDPSYILSRKKVKSVSLISTFAKAFRGYYCDCNSAPLI